ncbi:CLC2E protein, partial [Penelope pileata]|nr:CLC2E protein [Penelope pileata]
QRFFSLKAFIARYQGLANLWIRLHREGGDTHWTWTNGAAFTARLFVAQVGSPCAYLNEDRISSSHCHTQKNWLCSKPNKYIL